MQAMVQNTSLCITAWDRDKLVGVARSLTDFHYACYISELAVDQSYQKLGIASKMIALTKQQLNPRCKIRLIAAPAAAEFYPKAGFVPNSRCWELK
jgi:ribosomal protein S18 acetylase RimI-like enzyme